jgi:hypothetical protein
MVGYSEVMVQNTAALPETTSARGWVQTDAIQKVSTAILGKDRSAGKQPAKGKQQKPRLAQSDVPENA